MSHLEVIIDWFCSRYARDISIELKLIDAISLFADLPDKTFYPTVSAVYGNTEVSMIYLGHPLDG